jgi:hypothetical protein
LLFRLLSHGVMAKVTADGRDRKYYARRLARRRSREQERIRRLTAKVTAKAAQQREGERLRALHREARKAPPKAKRRSSKAACDERVEVKEAKVAQFKEALDWCAAKDKGAKACTKLSLSN